MSGHVMRVVSGCLAVIGLVAASAHAQAPPPQAPRSNQGQAGGQSGGVLPANPGEVGRLFDAYAVLQAQEQLGLDEEAFGRFLPRFRGLVDARRRQMQGRMRLLSQLGRLTRAASPDEAALRGLLRQLDEHEAAAAAEVQKASEGVAALLTPLQQARFRLFEEQMERRKLDLLTRARQGGNRRAPRVP